MWCEEDNLLLERLGPNAVLFVGDLSDGDLRIVKSVNQLRIPKAVMLGNHDRGNDLSGELLNAQIRLLGNNHCGWGLRDWTSPSLAVVGGRPCSPGGGFYLSPAVKSVFGPVTLEQSVERIVLAAQKAPLNWPLVILAHSGPTGLGSDFDSPCGRDWKSPALDWGDKDLSLAIDQIRKIRVPSLVVFGHMHHSLRRGRETRKTYTKDRWGTVYLNAACVPRKGKDSFGDHLSHFSWVEFENGSLISVSHRWFRPDASIAYEQKLFPE